MMEKAMLGLAALVAIGVLYVARDSIPQVRGVLGATHPTVSDPSPAKPPAAKPARATHRSRPRSEESAADRPEVPVAATPVPPAPSAPKAIPDAGQVNSGMRESEVLAQYGLPASTAISVEAGELREKLIYRDQAKLTAVVTRGGTVVSSRTEPEGQHAVSSPQLNVKW
ncbi:MAG TPA: hypothetical protein VKR61_07710 [Bryobacteraceae bacterium]|nr:hypothetical protein [Bryobacteraceae bacterium]